VTALLLGFSFLPCSLCCILISCDLEGDSHKSDLLNS
jgi:hypothetical protein